MDVTIDIIDTKEDVVLSMEKALGSSVILDWKGGDTKELDIVGSSLSFTMLGMEMTDGQYYDLFTGDETRYKVVVYTPDATIWSGFLLPDAYAEPYKNAPIEVSFTATDGLGRLKGKFPELKKGLSRIQIIAECLKLTGLNMDFRFAPALENYFEKDWNKIYPDPRGYEDKDAYTILSDLLQLCTIYQADDHFNIEGWNVRNLQSFATKVYDIDGTFLRNETVNRLRKDVTAIATPDITMQPPYGTIEVRHEREDVSLAEGLSSISDDEWINYSSSVDTGEVYADEWIMDQRFPVLSKEGKVYFGKYNIGQTSPQLQIKRQPFLEKWERYKITMGFRLVEDDEDIEEYTEAMLAFWSNPFYYSIMIGDNTIYSNITSGNGILRTFGFSEDNKDVELVFEFTAPYSGNLDIVILPIPSGNNDNIKHIEITTLELETMEFEEDEIARETLTEDYTEVLEVDLLYGGDATGESIGYRLERLGERNFYKVFQVEINRQFAFKDEWIVIVDLKYAQLVDKNKSGVEAVSMDDGKDLEDVLRVEYNYNGSQEHAIIFENGVYEIAVFVWDYNSVTGPRDNWEKWSDAVYGIEQKSYTDAYLGVLGRMFSEPLPKWDGQLYENIKFNDIILFPYRGEKDFVITSCRWDIDNGFSRITAIEAHYGDMGPIVEAGDDIYFTGYSVDTVKADAVSPTGWIESYQWSVVEGDATLANSGTATPWLLDVTSDHVILEVTVTDNEDRTATDRVELFRMVETEYNFETVYYSENDKTYKVSFDPEIPEGYAVNLRGSITVITNQVFMSDQASIVINGVQVSRFLGLDHEGDRLVKSYDFSFNYIAGDEIRMTLVAGGTTRNDDDSIRMILKVASASFVEGRGIVTGLPKTMEITVIG